jgi:hypothetical protein
MYQYSSFRMYQYSSFHTYVDCHVTKSKVQAGAVTVKEFQKLVFTAKKKQFLTSNNPLFFNGCVLIVNKDILRIRQKNQG